MKNELQQGMQNVGKPSPETKLFDPQKLQCNHTVVLLLKAVKYCAALSETLEMTDF